MERKTYNGYERCRMLMANSTGLFQCIERASDRRGPLGLRLCKRHRREMGATEVQQVEGEQWTVK